MDRREIAALPAGYYALVECEGFVMILYGIDGIPHEHT
jgi:hypothetical protein